MGGALIVPSDEKQAGLAKNHVQPQSITLGVRPEHIALLGDGGRMLHGTVDVSEMMGSSVHLHLSALGRDVIVIVSTMDLRGPHPTGFVSGQDIAFTFGGNVVHLFDRETGKNLEQ